MVSSDMLKTKIISQTHEIYQGNASALTIPTTNGIITVLPNHMDLVSLLTMGVVQIQEQNSTLNILVNSGLVQVKENIVTILSDEAFLPQDILLNEINTAIDSAKQHIAAPLSGTELIQLEKQLRFELFKKNFVENN